MTVLSRSTASRLDPRLLADVWSLIEERLADGEPLAATPLLSKAAESAYRKLTGSAPSSEIRRELRRHVREVNDARPESYLALGVQNAVQNAFARGVERLRWEVIHVEQYGTASINRFLRRDRIRDFLVDSRLDASAIDVHACVRHGVAWVRENSSSPSARTLHSVSAAGHGAEVETEDLDAAQLLLTIQAGLAPAEARRRLRELDRLRWQLFESVTDQLDSSIDTYVKDGQVSAREAENYQIERQNGAMPDLAGKPSSKLADAVSNTVACLQIFRSLQRIRDGYDTLFRTLIQHKELVLGSDDDDRTHLMSALLSDPGSLSSAVAVMGRRDPELRVLAARAAPYDRLEALEAGDSFAIEPSFVDDLRDLSIDDYARKLHSPDKKARLRAREDLHGFIQLLDRLIEATPFRRKMRLLIANRILTERTPEIESVYQSGVSVSASRSRAEQILNQQLRPVFVEASPEESAAVQRRRQGLLMTIEQKLAAEESDPGSTEDVAARAPAETLSQIEISRGAQLAEVAVRIGGSSSTMEGIIMPSPEDSKRMVLVERDESGELTPQLRRGRLRYVDQQADGSWRALTG